MTMALAINSSDAAIGNAGADRVRRIPPPELDEPFAVQAIGTDGDAPVRIIPIVRAPIRPSRYQWVEALVTFTVMAWFTAVLVWMVGELYGGPSGPLAEISVSTIAPMAMPQVSAGPANVASSGSSSI